MTASLAVRPNSPLAYPPGVPLETWAERGRELVEAHELSRWQLAVWWEYGDRHYAEAIQVAEDLGISPRLLHRGAYIIRACEKLPSTVDCRAIPFWNWEPLAHKALEDDERAMLASKVISEKMPQPKIKALVSEYLKAKSLPEPEQPKFENGLADKPVDDGLPLAPHGVTRGDENGTNDDGRTQGNTAEGGSGKGGSSAAGSGEGDGDRRLQGLQDGQPELGDPASLRSLDQPGHAVLPGRSDGLEGAASAEDQPEVGYGYPGGAGEGIQGGSGHPFRSTILIAQANGGRLEEVCLSAETLRQINLLRRYYKQPDMTVAQVIERAIGQLCNGALKARLARFE